MMKHFFSKSLIKQGKQSTSPLLNLLTKKFHNFGFNKQVIKSFPFSSLLRLQSRSFAEAQKSYKDIMKEYEQNFKKVSELTNTFNKTFLSSLQDEHKLISKLEEINSYPITLSQFPEFKKLISDSYKKIPITTEKSLYILFNIFDKLEIEDSSDNILNHYTDFLLKNLSGFTYQTLSAIYYTYSKGFVKDQKLWEKFESSLIQNLDKFNIKELSMSLISFAMVSNKNKEFYSKIVKQVQILLTKDTFSHLEVFRICFSLTRGIIPLKEINQDTWKLLQEHFYKNISHFNLFQISKILLLFNEVPIFYEEVYSKAEEEISKEYLNQIDEIKKENPDSVNLKAFFDDLTNSVLTFAIQRRGSKYFWTSYFKTVQKINEGISVESLENLLFIIVQASEMHNIQNINQDSDIKNVVDIIRSKIHKENLLTENLINPFNLMMSLSTLRIGDKELWVNLLNNVIKTIKNEKFVNNPYLLSDIVYGFGTYETAILPIENQQPDDAFEKKRTDLWETLEILFNKINIDQFDELQAANIAWYFSQLGIGSKNTWESLQKIIEKKIKTMDNYNFILSCMAFSTMEIQDAILWTQLEKQAILILNKLSIDELRKIIFSFLKIKECKLIWPKIEEVLSTESMLSRYTLDNFADFQLPLAVTEIKNKQIWNKFEELVFKNLKIFEQDQDLLMNTIFSFSKIGQGSKILWDKLVGLIRERLSTYESDDLGHIIICLNKIVTDQKFWEEFNNRVEAHIDNAKLSGANNLLKGITSNDYLKNKTKTIKRLEDRVQVLLKELNK